MSDLTVEPYTNWRNAKHFWEPAYTWNGLQLRKEVVDNMPTIRLAFMSSRAQDYARTNKLDKDIDIYARLIEARVAGEIPDPQAL